MRTLIPSDSCRLFNVFFVLSVSIFLIIYLFICLIEILSTASASSQACCKQTSEQISLAWRLHLAGNKNFFENGLHKTNKRNGKFQKCRTDEICQTRQCLFSSFFKFQARIKLGNKMITRQIGG